MKNKNHTIKSSKPSYENKFEPVAHGCVRWSKFRLILVKNNHGRDEVLSEQTVEVEHYQLSSFWNLLSFLRSFVSSLVPEKERGSHRYALVVQVPALDLFGCSCWDDVKIAWL